MEHLRKLKDTLMRELEKLSEGDISIYQLDDIHKLTDIIKNIDKIEMYEDGNRYSGMRERGTPRSYDYNDSYGDDDDYSMRRKRDARGRYTRDDGRDYMVNELESMMREAPDRETREKMERLVNRMKGM